MSRSQVSRPSLRRRLLSGEPLAGPFLKIPAAEVTELAAVAGFDLVVIDLEHGPFSVETATHLVRAARSRGIGAVVRTAGCSGTEIARALDTGADGVIIPGVASVTDAERAIGHARFHPVGERGTDLYARAADWGATPREDYLRHANEEVLVGVMVEAVAALTSLERIAKVEGLDLLFVGPYDLSQSLGVPGQVRRPEVVEQILLAVDVARRNDKVVGLYVDDVDDAIRYRERGVGFIGMSNDADILRRALTLLRTSGTASAAGSSSTSR